MRCCHPGHPAARHAVKHTAHAYLRLASASIRQPVHCWGTSKQEWSQEFAGAHLHQTLSTRQGNAFAGAVQRRREHDNLQVAPQNHMVHVLQRRCLKAGTNKSLQVLTSELDGSPYQGSGTPLPPCGPGGNCGANDLAAASRLQGRCHHPRRSGPTALLAMQAWRPFMPRCTIQARYLTSIALAASHPAKLYLSGSIAGESLSLQTRM